MLVTNLEPTKGGPEAAWKTAEKSGGRGWDRTSDPYDVNVVLFR